MSVDSRAKQYGKIFGDWVIRELIGQGSGGKTAVFRLSRNKLSYEEISVMKVINIIEEQGVYKDLSEEYKEAYRTMCEDLCKKAEDEVRLMYRLKGHSNIVNYLDCDWGDWEDENCFGCDLLIRMDFLDNVGSLMKKKFFAEADILKMGKDICNALIACHNINIIHRDIKPDNIFVNKGNCYMLGDFGVSKMIEDSQSSVTMTGTRAYAAPEQFTKNYDKRVDIYSLGITLYELANANKLPFAQSSYVKMEDIQMRLNGKRLPMPTDVCQELGKVILKACENDVDKRYQSAEEFLAALESIKVDMSTTTTNAEVSGLKSMSIDWDDAYATAPALGVGEKLNVYDPYTTAPALSAEKEFDVEDFYATAPAIVKMVQEENSTAPKIEFDPYATMPAMTLEQTRPVIEEKTVEKTTTSQDDISCLTADPIAVANKYKEQGQETKADIWYQKTESKIKVKFHKIKYDDWDGPSTSGVWYGKK